MSIEKDVVVASTDAQLGSGGDDYVKTENGETCIIGSPVEKSLVDRSNLGNAKTDGLEKDLGIQETNMRTHWSSFT
ncbi:hypothetical protein IFR05_011768 [Cadophora sp. M221]|nr:hypothetical protein IFR05_011768 [Cadophora sp. M221]